MKAYTERVFGKVDDKDVVAYRFETEAGYQLEVMTYGATILRYVTPDKAGNFANVILGFDDFDSYDFLCDFVQKVHQAGCQEFIVHARKAWLSGLSPKQNREIPPLNYERVYQLKQDFPHLLISINGGIKTLEEMQQHLKYVDGVMVGREAYQNPALLGHIDHALFDANAPIITPRQAMENMFPYIEQQLSQGVYLNHIVRHMLGAFQNCKGARQWRRYLSENAYKAGAGIDVIETALGFVEE